MAYTPDGRLFFDTETGGFIPRKHGLLTIGLVAHSDRRGVVATDHILIKTQPNKIYEEEALATNHINLVEHDKEALDLKDAAKRMYNFVVQHINGGKPLNPKWKPRAYGHNIPFDIKFTEQLFHEAGYDTPFTDYGFSDTKDIAQWFMECGLLNVPDVKLGTLINYFGLQEKFESSALHNSLVDTLATREVWLKLRELTKSLKTGA